MPFPIYVHPITIIREAEMQTPAKMEFQKYQTAYGSELKKKEDADQKFGAGTLTGEALVAAYDAFTTFEKTYKMAEIKAKIESAASAVTTSPSDKGAAPSPASPGTTNTSEPATPVPSPTS